MDKFSYYKKGITNLIPTVDLTLKGAIAKIRSEEFREDIERLRSAEKKTVRESIKKHLHYFTFSGTFKKRHVDGLIKHSGLLVLDFDHLPDAVASKEIITADGFVAACFISPSGDGLKVIVKIDPKRHLDSFTQLATYFKERYNMPLDESGKDHSRACFASYDPDAFLNEKSLQFLPFTENKLEIKEAKPAVEVAVETTAENPPADDHHPGEKRPGGSKEFERKQNLERVLYCVEQIEERHVDITDNDYDDRLAVGFALSTLGEDARELYHRAVQYNDAYTPADADYKFSDALAKCKFTTPAKFFKLCKIHGILISKPRTIAEAKKEVTAGDLIGDEENTSDYLKFGIWEFNGTYWSLDLKGQKYEISNFKMKIFYHIKTNEDVAYRLIEIKNIHKHSAVIKVNTDDLVSVGTFKKIVARNGNFLFKGTEVDLGRLSDKLQREEKPTKLIKQLGWHRTGKFFAFANGIHDAAANKFIPVDELGIVEHFILDEDKKPKPQNYFIPAMSKMFSDKEDMFANDKKFIYQSSNVTFEGWAAKFTQVYGKQGMMGLTFYMMAIFSDIIFVEMSKRFPLLHVYGKRGTGKGSMIASLMRLFGEGQDQFMLGGAGTTKAFMRKFSQYSNSLVWLDEYKNNLKTTFLESLKNIFDRIGYERSKMDNTFETEVTPIYSACILSGQEMPTIEPALFTRVILLSYTETSYSDAEREQFRQLKELEDKGLSGITVHLLQYRKWIQDNFKTEFIRVQKELMKSVNNQEIDERLYANYASMITVAELMSTKETLPFSMVSFKEICKKNLLEQFYVLKGSDDASKFWDVVEMLFNQGQIMEEKHFRLKNGYLYIRVQDIYQAYAEALQKRRDMNGLDKETLYKYLESDAKSFVAKQKKFFGGAQRWCHVFIYKEVGVDLIRANSQDELLLRYKSMGIKVEDEQLEMDLSIKDDDDDAILEREAGF